MQTPSAIPSVGAKRTHAEAGHACCTDYAAGSPTTPPATATHGGLAGPAYKKRMLQLYQQEQQKKLQPQALLLGLVGTQTAAGINSGSINNAIPASPGTPGSPTSNSSAHAAGTTAPVSPPIASDDGTAGAALPGSSDANDTAAAVPAAAAEAPRPASPVCGAMLKKVQLQRYLQRLASLAAAQATQAPPEEAVPQPERVPLSPSAGNNQQQPADAIADSDNSHGVSASAGDSCSSEDGDDACSSCCSSSGSVCSQ